jgi:regulator of sirC expression with transglutaminase-like and TPR domain
MDNFKREIESLFALLDDPQPVVQVSVEERLLELGEAVVPFLRELVIEKNGENSEQVENYVKRIRTHFAVQRISDDFENSDSAIDLEAGVYTIISFGYPGANVVEVRKRLDEMAHDIAVLAGTRSTAFERFMRMRSYLFSELGFIGNREDYYNPDNSYINKVLEMRRGIPISLSVLMMLLGKRLDIPLLGIGMPMHFLLQFDDGTRNFYVDPFTSGMIITSEQCQAMLSSSGIKLTPDMLSPVTDRDILERMWRNLYLAYQQNDRMDEASMVADLLKLVSPEFEINDFGTDEDDEDEEEEF